MDVLKRSERLLVVIPALLLVVGIALLFFFSTAQSAERAAEQNSLYIADATRQNAQAIDSSIISTQDSIASVAQLFSQLPDADSITASKLGSLESTVRFDRLSYVNAEGMGIDSSGNTWRSEKNEAFYDGLKGHSGVGFNKDKKHEGGDAFENSLLYYAPVEQNDKVEGVLFGYCSDKTISERIQGSFFGYQSTCLLCLPDGTVLAGSADGVSAKTVQEYLASTGLEDDQVARDLSNALGSRLSQEIEYGTDRGSASVFIADMPRSGLMLVQTFPPEAIQDISSRLNGSTVLLAVSLGALLALFIIALLLLNMRHQHMLEKEKASFSNMINGVKNVFSRMAVIDFEKNTYEYMAHEDGAWISGLAAKGPYQEFVRKAYSEFKDPDNPERTMEELVSKQYLQSHMVPGVDVLRMEYLDSTASDNRYMDLSILCLERKDGVPVKVLFASQDCTDARNEELRRKQALSEAFQAADRANQAKSDFLSKMSHDIRTPMNAVVGMTAIAQANVNDPEKVSACLDKITTSSRHLLALINEVLDMSRIESGKMSLSSEEFNLSDLMQTLLDLMRPSIQERHHELRVDVRNLVHEDVIGDSLRIQQVFTNIVGNAVKYTPEGGCISITVTERPVDDPMMSVYEFVFEDNGIGMTQEFLDKIYLPFERAVDSRVDSVQGTGLGMAIVHNIVQMMGGDVKIESRPGQGTRVSVTVRLKLQRDRAGAFECLKGLRVLVADDEKSTCEATCTMLESLGMKADWVQSGDQAVARADQELRIGKPYFAVLLDWKMPGMKNFAAVSLLREKVGSSVPLVLMSAYEWSDVEGEARSCGIDAFVAKPLFKSKLSSVMKALVGTTSPNVAEQALRRKSGQARNRVLLVEDNDINREIGVELLDMLGIEPETAENGQRALDLFEASPENYYAMILMDVQMPVMNGYDATRAIRSLDRPDAKSVPILAMTANAFVEDVEEARAAGMNEHLSKPISISSLQDVVGRWINGGSAGSDEEASEAKSE